MSPTLVEKDGRVYSLLPGQVKLTPLNYWQAKDGTRYPVGWRLQVPGYGLDLEVQALLDDQLMDHSVRYWEGAVDVEGDHRPLAGAVPPRHADQLDEPGHGRASPAGRPPRSGWRRTTSSPRPARSLASASSCPT